MLLDEEQESLLVSRIEIASDAASAAKEFIDVGNYPKAQKMMEIAERQCAIIKAKLEVINGK